MNQVAKVENKSPSAEFRDQWTRQEQEITAALPPHIPVERFMRVVMTAVSASPDLLSADRRSLFESSMKAAQDGLLPDGRDGALVIFNAKVKENGKDIWIKKVQWMPMVGGILKKVRNSGELLTISAYVAYERDEFEYTLGDEESIVHRPCLEEDRGRPRLVYAVAKTKDGGVYREIMTFKDVEKVRGVSRAKDTGPWKDWWDEMAKKTVIRRLAKRLPMSSDLDDLIRRDDDLYDFQGKRADMEDMRRQLQAPSIQERLQQAREASQEPAGEQEGFDAAHVARETSEALTGEIIEPQNAGEDIPAPSADDAAPATAASEGGTAQPQDAVPPSTNPWLLNIARMLWAATNYNGDVSILKAQKQAAVASYPKPDDCPVIISGKAEAVYAYCKQITEGSLEPDDGLAIIAGVVGCDQDDLKHRGE